MEAEEPKPVTSSIKQEPGFEEEATAEDNVEAEGQAPTSTTKEEPNPGATPVDDNDDWEDVTRFVVRRGVPQRSAAGECGTRKRAWKAGSKSKNGSKKRRK